MSEHIRRVASPEGAQFYGLPIGAPITADAKAAAKLKNGGKAEPTGASKKGGGKWGWGNKGGNASAATNAKAAVEKAASATPVKAPKTKTKLKKPTIKGNLHFKVGSADYTAPNGSKLFHQKGVDGLAYVQTPDGKVHIFNEKGEVETDSTAILQVLSKKFDSELSADDPDFETADFDKVGAHYSLEQVPVGGGLTDQRGNLVFTKNEDGTWHNEDLGVDLEEKSVQPLFDAGDLIPEKTPESDSMSEAFAQSEHVDFKSMSSEEALAAIQKLKTGTPITVHSANEENNVALVKNEDGSWTSKSTGGVLSSEQLSYVKDTLNLGDNTEVTPAMGEDPKGAPAPKKSKDELAKEAEANGVGFGETPAAAPEPTDRALASKQAIADSNPYKPKEVDFLQTYPGGDDFPKETKKPQDLENAAPGDTALVTYFTPEDGPGADYYDIAVFTQQEDSSWWDQDSIQKISPEEMSALVEDPDTKVYPSKDSKGAEITRAKAKEARLKAQEAAIKDATAQNSDAPKKLVDNKPQPVKTAPAESPEGMVKGGSIKSSLDDLAIGHKVALKFNGKTGKGLASNTVYTKTADDNWHQDNDPTTFGDKNSQWLLGQVNQSTKLVNEAYPAPAAPAEPEKKVSELQTGDKPSKDWVTQAETGSSVLFTSIDGSSFIWEKNSDSDWVNGTGGTVFPQDIFSDVISTPSANSSIVSIGKSQAVKDAEAMAAPQAPSYMEVGGKPETVDHLKEYAEGTSLLYDAKGGKKTTYVKLGSGDYLSPAGQVLSPEKLKNSVVQGKFEVGSVPAVVQAPVEGQKSVDAQYLVPNAQIDKFGVLNGYPLGTTIKDSAGTNYNGITLVKTEDGWHSEKFGTYSTAVMEDALGKGDLYFVSSPKAAGVDPNSPDAPEVHSTAKDITFDSSGQAFSAAELKEAHDALENFSGPQINYGLKSVPDNVFAGDKDLQTKLKAWGKTAYPTLPPKQAAINVIKDKLGLKKEAPTEKKNSEGAPEISFGASGDGIKNTATGFTGGAYSAADVEQAISILEGFQGKNFKSELNKQNNPLGQLSPNDLVGFNKDKTVTKQKFIDLMKQKLDDHKSELQTSEMETDTDSDVEELADWEKELLYGPPSLAEGQTFVGDTDTLNSLPVGTEASLVGNENNYVWTKQEDGTWLLGGEGMTAVPASTLTSVQLKLTKKGDGSVAKSPDAPVPAEVNEAAKDGPSIGSIADKEALKDMLPGTVLTSQIGNKFTKVGTDAWQKEGWEEEFTSAEVKYATANFYYAHVPNAEESANLQVDASKVEEGGPSESISFTPGDYLNGSTASDFEAAPVGTTVQEFDEDGFSSDSLVYTKQADGDWVASNYSQDVMTNHDLSMFAPEGGYLILDSNQDHANAPTDMDIQTEAPGLKAGDPMTGLDQLNAQPAGTKVMNSGGYEFTKHPGGLWVFNDDASDDENLTNPMELVNGLEFGFQYHYTFIPAQETPLDTETHLTKDDIESSSIGDVITLHTIHGPYTEDYTKTADDEWHADSGITIDDSDLMDVLDQGDPYYTWTNKVNPVPHHADAPNAVKAKAHDDATLSAADIDNASVGQLYAHTDGETLYVKDGEVWTAYDKSTGEPKWATDSAQMKAGLEEGWLQHVPYDGPEYNKSGLMPGKYSSGGAAYMVVHADGTGTYVNGKGVASKLTSYKVKKNHESGMTYYQGIPNDVPAVPEAPQTTKKAKPAKLGDANLPDGTYFQGDPSNGKTPVIHVEGDKVTIQKGVGSTYGSPKKIGADADLQWVNAASLGAQVKGQGNSYGWKTGMVYTKTTDGWKGTDGELLDQSNWSGSVWPWAYGTIQSHGLTTPEEITKAKLQTMAKKGQITDQYGNSIVPSGYTGEVMFFGSKTSIPTLLLAQKKFQSPEPVSNQDLKDMGLYIPSANASKYVKDNFGELNKENNRAAISKKIDDVLSGVDTDIPESDAADLFEYNELGQPVPPANFGAYPAGYYDSITDKKKFVKDVGASFGGGGVIGQHTDGMDKSDLDTWVTYLQQGNFKAMYDLEVAAAASKGQSHVAGFKHPGYSENTETNQVSWSAAVSGEVSALDTVPGDWTPSNQTKTMDEVNNYLIAAQMQNPTYLADQEKRDWVTYHQIGSSYKQKVDSLSLLAKKRKDEGHAPLSDDVTWTNDLKPAKSYDVLFENKNQFPTSWNSTQAADYLNEHLDGDSEEDENLSTAYGVWQTQNPHAYSNAPFLNEYFQVMGEQQAQVALIPVYTKSPQQKVKKSTHPIYDYHDQHGTHYYFKPRPDSQEDKYRTEVEHLGNSLGRALGFKTAKSELMTLDGQYGQMQQDVGGVGDFSGFDFKTLTTKQIADIEGEHLLDYFMNNDDAKYDNAKIQADGSVVGIDKARSFGFYGQWDWEGSAADGNTTIYQNMYSAIRSGAFSKEDLDKAYLKARQHSVRISKFNEDRLREMMQEGMQNRTTYNVPYSIDGKQVSQDFDGLMAAVMDRKAKLPDIFDEKWQKLYADAKLGDLPDPTTAGPEGLVTGLQSDDAHEKMFQAKVAGITTQLSGAHVIGGTAHLWTDQYADGSTNMHGEMYLGPKMQENLNAYFTANASDISGSKAEVSGFEAVNNPVDQKFLAAVKTVNSHLTDGAYNESTMAAFKQQLETMKADLAEWNSTLMTNTTLPGGFEGYKFNSGTTVAMEHLDQYKLMADSYLEKSSPILTAYDTKTATGPYFAYTPVKLNKKDSFFTKEDGSTATPIKDSVYLIKDAPSGTVSLGTLDGEWTEVTPETTGSLGEDTGVKITKLAQTHELKATWENGVKTSKPGQHVGSQGSKGTEWEIELPTGERIRYRNSGLTDTAQAQHGKLVFTAEGVEDQSASQAAMANILDQLNTLGISTDAQTETDAELTYWREMYGILASRNHTKQSDKRYAAAEKDMWAKQAEIGGDKNHFLETLDEKLDPEEQAQFWRDLWSKHFGEEKVNDLIENRKYLPEFAHQDYDQPDLATGKPHFYRFDVDMDKLLKNDWMLATSTGGDPWERFKSGGLLSAEERMRQLDLFMGASGGYNTALEDQGNGGSHYIYTRLQKTSHTGSNVIYSPRVLLKTRSASFDGDVFGNVNKRKDRAPSDPLHVTTASSGWMGGSNETDIPQSATLLDDVEILSFDNPAKLNEAIQALKKRGIESIRGVPVEDRLVLHEKMAEAIANMKARWAKGEF